ncbi:MAG TPA: M20 family metallo-hydrolase [Candidatus Fimisoma avicola]|uniref:M20 family metallo-hydrolase n=1 Tax=Candidatus Fimisoma avicola TaxID=2840826 RepID=A0A9D1L707_9FIRM|nr:M20 family metallo-hydrolase [Candidatus Fimisoma avicola]
MRDMQWLLEAIEEAGRTAVKEDGTYWRASYTKEDKAVVELLQGYMESMGMETFFDAVGNLHGVIRGSEDDTVMTGSHRDTVRNGGKYDGILGVLCGIRAAGSLYEELGRPRRSLEVVAMVEEESSRFTASDYIGSCNIAGIMPESAFSLTDDHGITIQEAAVAAGYQGAPSDSKRDDIKHFVEMHIEQGGVLESENKQIGIIRSIVGQWGGTISFEGKQNHAGTTPMALRRDPVPVMAAFIRDLFDWVNLRACDMVLTIGKISVSPGSPNVIPQKVSFTYDARSSDLELGQATVEKIYALRDRYDGDIKVEVIPAWSDKPIMLDMDGVKELEEIVQELNLSYKVMDSGAGHDSQNMAKSYPTNMIFVPSVDGISHNVREYTKPEDLAAGLTVLKAYLKKLCW